MNPLDDTMAHTPPVGPRSRARQSGSAWRRDRCGDDGGTHMRTDDGYVLVLVALLLVPLLIMTAFAVDIGSWYAQGTKMQRAVDHAALAGVVWMPDEGEAERVAGAVVVLNGFEDPVHVAWPNDWQMEVSLSRKATRYFSGIIMTGDQVLTRSAIAAYSQPIPLGSPSNILGNDVEDCDHVYKPPYPELDGVPNEAEVRAELGSQEILSQYDAEWCAPDTQPYLWLLAEGPYTAHGLGNPFVTFCANNHAPFDVDRCGTQDNPVNPDYRPEGNSFAVDVSQADVDAGVDITINAWDFIQVHRKTWPKPGFPGPTNPHQDFDDGPANADCIIHISPTASNCQTGDWGPFDRNGLDMQIQVFDNDGSDVTIDYGVPLIGTDGQPCELFVPQGSPTGELALTPDRPAGWPASAPVQSEYVKWGAEQALNPPATDDDKAVVAQFKNKWAPVCTFKPTKAGVYPMRVKTSNITLGKDPTIGCPACKRPDFYDPSRMDGNLVIPTDYVYYKSGNPWNNQQRQNNYALNLTSTGSLSSKLYALDDMSVYYNTPYSDSDFYLAEIPSQHKGKVLRVDLFSPGGLGYASTMAIKGPPTGSPYNVSPPSRPLMPPVNGSTLYPVSNPVIADSCSANTTGSPSRGGGQLENLGDKCEVTTNFFGPIYGDSWARFEVQISPTYECTSDCWWILNSSTFGDILLDGLSVAVSIVGDPVRLVR